MSMGRSRVVSEMGRYSLGRSGHCQIEGGRTARRDSGTVDIHQQLLDIPLPDPCHSPGPLNGPA